MEAIVTEEPKGFAKEITAGSPAVINLTQFRSKYVDIYCAADDVWYNVAAADPGTAIAAALGDRTTESTTSELAGDGTVLPKFLPKKTVRGWVVKDYPFLIIDADSGTDVMVFVKPSSVQL